MAGRKGEPEYLEQGEIFERVRKNLFTLLPLTTPVFALAKAGDYPKVDEKTNAKFGFNYTNGVR